MASLFQWIIDLLKELRVWVTVLPWEKCVRVRLGKFATELEPGYHWKWPGIDKVWPVNNRTRFTSFPVQSLTTKDGLTLHIAGLIGFSITEPLLAMQNLAQPESSCSAMTMAIVSSHVPQHDFAELDKAELEAEVLGQLRLSAPGIKFEFVSLTDWAQGPTFRMLKESWLPETRPDRDPYDK
jgi:regulator of protease activity HflC (stomatin/prohibitin superfamily)